MAVELKDVKIREPGIGIANPGFKHDDSRNQSLNNVSDEKVQDNGTKESNAYDPEANEVTENENCFIRGIAKSQEAVSGAFKSNKRNIKRAVCIILAIAYFCYFGYAMYYRFGDEGSIRLLWVTCLVVAILIIRVIFKFCGKPIKSCFKAIGHLLNKHSTVFKWIAVFIVAALVVAFLVVEVILKQPYNMVSFGGLVLYVLLFFIFSHNPAKVKWRPVYWGLILQFVFAYIILRTYWGFAAFEWLGERVTEFLEHTDAGSSFVFGEAYLHHYFALKVLPVIIFFSTAISILYYLGAMQVVIKSVAIVMQTAMKTTAAESLNAAGNIFIGQTEAPLMIRPLLSDMTRSELHAVMTGGFATIAGGVLAAYISIGVPANHLLSASVMSAPAALAMAKLAYPETEESRTTAKDVMKMERPPERNLIEAASTGASASVKLVANIVANLIAFLALLAFLNATLTWLGDRVGIENLTFELICSYLLWPFSLAMGVDLQDCRKIAELLGVKTFLNEFIAYNRLGVLIKNTRTYENYTTIYNTTGIYDGDNLILPNFNTTLIGGIITKRSEVIATYALCGFSNIGSIGIQLGALGSMAPHRKSDLSRVALRAMIAGNVACFMTACIAGLFYQPNP